MRSKLNYLFGRIKGVPIFALLVLILALASTVAAHYYISQKKATLINARIEVYKNLLIARMIHHLDDYAQVLRGAAGLLNASQEVTREEWKEYVRGLNLHKYYPGIELLGYVPAKKNALYAKLSYDEPTHPLSEAVFKPDAKSQHLRDAAMAAARDQNNVTISKKLVLVEEKDGRKQLGFLMLFPIYQKGMKLETLSDRRNALQGYVYSVFQSKNFIKEVSDRFDDYLEVHIYDGPEAINKDLIYKSVSEEEAEKVYEKFQSSNQMLVGNHVWSMSARLKEGKKSFFYADDPVSIWALGLILSVLLFVLAWVIISYRQMIKNATFSDSFMSLGKKIKVPQDPLFFSKLFHEIRSPLHNILAISKVLSSNKSQNLTNKQLEQVNLIHKAGNDLLAIVDDAMDLTNIQSGSALVHFESIDIREFANSIHVAFEALAHEKKLSLTVTVDDNVPSVIFSDLRKVRSMVSNLCMNAIKFTQVGSVTVHFYQPGLLDTLAIAVMDTGCGISEDHIVRLFQPFEQAPFDEASTLGGVGLGLAICHALATLLSGEIIVRSEVGKGSCFTLYLPMNTTLKGTQ